jgi:hypothetical protein
LTGKEALVHSWGLLPVCYAQKEHTPKRNILLDISSKQPVSPRSGHEAIYWRQKAERDTRNKMAAVFFREKNVMEETERTVF